MSDTTEAMRAALECRLKQHILYDPSTGVLTRKIGSGGATAGSVVGRISRGYLKFSMLGRTLMTHRVCWFLYYGAWPRHEIDHVNAIKHDNRIENLRDVAHAENMQNQHFVHKINTSGFLGVTRSESWRAKPWRAAIRIDGKMKTIGRFHSAEEAGAAYIAEKKKLHAGYVHG